MGYSLRADGAYLAESKDVEAEVEGVEDLDNKRFRGIRFDADSVFIFLFSIMPLVDTLNGMLIRSGSAGALTAGDMYRLIVIVTSATFYLFRFDRGNITALLISVVFGLASILIRVLAGLGEGGASEVNLVAQWMLSPMLVLCIYSSVRSGTLKRRSIRKVFDYLQWLAPATILIPYALGAGYSTYGSADGSFVGYKAFYYATNGISLMLIVLFTRAVYRMLDGRSLLSLTVVILNGASLALIGTKSSLAMLVIAFFVALYCIYGDRLLRLLVRMLPLIVALFTVAYFLMDQITDFLAPVLGRWDYFSTRVYTNDLIGALTSGRVYQIGIHWKELATSPMGLLAFVIGMGDLSAKYRICEMDYFDIFFQFGVVGLMLLLVFISFVMAKGYRANGKRGFEYCMVIFLLLYALIVGHVFNNAMSSMVFSLVSVLAMTEERAKAPRGFIDADDSAKGA